MSEKHYQVGQTVHHRGGIGPVAEVVAVDEALDPNEDRVTIKYQVWTPDGVMRPHKATVSAWRLRADEGEASS